MREKKDYRSVVSHPYQVFNGIFLTLPLELLSEMQSCVDSSEWPTTVALVLTAGALDDVKIYYYSTGD